MWCLIVKWISFLINFGYGNLVCCYNRGNILNGVNFGIVFILLIYIFLFFVKKKLVCVKFVLFNDWNVIIVLCLIILDFFFVILVGIISVVLLLIYFDL